MNYRYIAICAIAASLYAFADDMVIEVTQDFSVNILENLPDKPYLAPQLLPVPASGLALSPYEYTGTGSIARIPAAMPAPLRPLAVQPSPFRGYASLAYAPALNIGANAGYRVVSKPGLSVGAWGQYSLSRYRSVASRLDMGTSDLALGIDAYARVKAAGALAVNAWFTRLDALHPAPRSWRHATNDFAASVDWRGTPSQAWTYTLGADFRHSAFSVPDSLAAPYEAPAQSLFAFRAGAKASLSADKALALAIDADVRSLSSAQSHPSQTLASVSPALRYSRGALSAAAGIVASFGSGPGCKGARVAPEASISYVPARSVFSAALSVTGGRRLNPVADLVQLNPYLLGSEPYAVTFIPVDAALRASVAPIAGLSLSASVRYARAKGALRPSLYNKGMFAADLGGWLFSAEAAYAYSGYAKASVRYQRGQRGSHAWYEWLDGAASVLDCSLAVTPINPLAIEATYSLRTGRRLYGADSALPLGNVSDLGLSATYRFTPRLAASLSASNLLGRRHLLVSGYSSEPCRVFAGVSYKF